VSWRSGGPVLRAAAARVGVGDRITRNYVIRGLRALMGPLGRGVGEDSGGNPRSSRGAPVAKYPQGAVRTVPGALRTLAERLTAGDPIISMAIASYPEDSGGTYYYCIYLISFPSSCPRYSPQRQVIRNNP
jgi:hypothetical protein